MLWDLLHKVCPCIRYAVTLQLFDIIRESGEPLWCSCGYGNHVSYDLALWISHLCQPQDQQGTNRPFMLGNVFQLPLTRTKTLPDTWLLGSPGLFHLLAHLSWSSLTWAGQQINSAYCSEFKWTQIKEKTRHWQDNLTQNTAQDRRL